MNLFNIKNLPKTISVFLLLAGFTCFAVKFFMHGEIEVLLRNELKQISANEVMTWKGVELSDKERTMSLNNNLPVFKTKTQSGSESISNTEVDFSLNSNLEKDASIKSNISAPKSGLGNNINITNYSYSPKKSVTTYAAVKNVSNNINTIQSRNTQSINTDIQTVANFMSNSPSFSNTSSNAFLANNSLSLTTDLSGSNSPMLIDGGSNPGDPGVPVGDGTWVLMGLMVGYVFYFRFRG